MARLHLVAPLQPGAGPAHLHLHESQLSLLPFLAMRRAGHAVRGLSCPLFGACDPPQVGCAFVGAALDMLTFCRHVQTCIVEVQPYSAYRWCLCSLP
jgi:hypothetical protein